MDCYFFGTFNPIHLGHIEIARRVRELAGFDKVIFVPSYMPPHKIDDLLPYAQRLEMVKIAVGEDCTSDIEHKLKVPSYTYRTVEYLFEQSKEKVNFIIGYDQFFKLESWKEPEILKKLINFVVIPRKFQNGQVMGDRAFDYFKNRGYEFQVLNIDFLDVSSSMIRKLLANNEDITGLTTPEVKKYIEDNRLYKSVAQEKFIR